MRTRGQGSWEAGGREVEQKKLAWLGTRDGENWDRLGIETGKKNLEVKGGNWNG